MHVTLFPSNEDIPSRLCSTPQPPPKPGHVAHSVDSGTSWLRAQQRNSQYEGQSPGAGQLWPGYPYYGFSDKGSVCSSSQVRL